MFSFSFLFALAALVFASVMDLRTGMVYDLPMIVLLGASLTVQILNGFTTAALVAVPVGLLLLAVNAGLVVEGYLGGADWFAYLALLLALPFQTWLLANLVLGLYFSIYLIYANYVKKDTSEMYVVHLYLLTLLTTKLLYTFTF